MFFFSVVIPVYNASPWIEECLKSVVEQSFMDFEVVIVNDGSEDDSLQKIENFKSENPSLEWKIISQENRGLGAARNRAVEASEGKWLAFLDADDYWTVNKLQISYNQIMSNDSEWLYHGIFERSKKGNMRARNLWAIDSIEQFITYGNPITPSATVIKKSLFLEYKGFDEERDRVEDLGLWLRLLNEQETVLYFMDNLTVYRLGSGLTTNMEDHYSKVIKAVESTGLDLSEDLMTGFKQRKLYEMARQYHKNRDFSEAQRMYANHSGVKVSLLTLLAKLRIRV